MLRSGSLLSTAPSSLVEEAVESMQEDIGFTFKLSKPAVVPPLAYLLQASCVGSAADDLSRLPGSCQCLYDSVAYLCVGSSFADVPDGPHTARDFNTDSFASSQRGPRVCWIRHLPITDTREFLSSSVQSFICWQPHCEGNGHFFAFQKQANELSLMDSAIGQRLDVQVHEFLQGWNRIGQLVFFTVDHISTESEPSMTGDAYDLAGAG